MPLVNYHALKRRASNLFLWRKKDNGNRGVTFTKCAECNETPVLPHHMGCSHIFCFYCIKVRISFFVHVTVFHTFTFLSVLCLFCHMYVVASDVLTQGSYLRSGSNKKSIESTIFQIWLFSIHTLMSPGHCKHVHLTVCDIFVVLCSYFHVQLG